MNKNRSLKRTIKSSFPCSTSLYIKVNAKVQGNVPLTGNRTKVGKFKDVHSTKKKLICRNREGTEAQHRKNEQ